jgi:hypothetical protein
MLGTSIYCLRADWQCRHISVRLASVLEELAMVRSLFGQLLRFAPFIAYGFDTTPRLHSVFTSG